MKNNPRIENIKCPKCKHKHMWIFRGKSDKSQYINKCSKCGYKIE